MRAQWDQWMMSTWDQISAADATPKPTRQIVSQWVIAAYDGFPPNAIRNAWTKNGFAWFDKSGAEEDVESQDKGEDNEDEDEDEDDFVLRTLWSDDNNNENDEDDDEDEDDHDGVGEESAV
jgi:hypothetical protein